MLVVAGVVAILMLALPMLAVASGGAARTRDGRDALHDAAKVTEDVLLGDAQQVPAQLPSAASRRASGRARPSW